MNHMERSVVPQEFMPFAFITLIIHHKKSLFIGRILKSNHICCATILIIEKTNNITLLNQNKSISHSLCVLQFLSNYSWVLFCILMNPYNFKMHLIGKHDFLKNKNLRSFCYPIDKVTMLQIISWLHCRISSIL